MLLSPISLNTLESKMDWRARSMVWVIWLKDFFETESNSNNSSVNRGSLMKLLTDSRVSRLSSLSFLFSSPIVLEYPSTTSSEIFGFNFAKSTLCSTLWRIFSIPPTTTPNRARLLKYISTTLTHLSTIESLCISHTRLSRMYLYEILLCTSMTARFTWSSILILMAYSTKVIQSIEFRTIGFIWVLIISHIRVFSSLSFMYSNTLSLMIW